MKLRVSDWLDLHSTDSNPDLSNVVRHAIIKLFPELQIESNDISILRQANQDTNIDEFTDGAIANGINPNQATESSNQSGRLPKVVKSHVLQHRIDISISPKKLSYPNKNLIRTNLPSGSQDAATAASQAIQAENGNKRGSIKLSDHKSEPPEKKSSGNGFLEQYFRQQRSIKLIKSPSESLSIDQDGKKAVDGDSPSKLSGLFSIGNMRGSRRLKAAVSAIVLLRNIGKYNWRLEDNELIFLWHWRGWNKSIDSNILDHDNYKNINWNKRLVALLLPLVAANAVIKDRIDTYLPVPGVFALCSSYLAIVI